MSTVRDKDVFKPDVLFTLLSDPTRLRCLFLIYKRVELCVCELSHGLAISQPKISRHLALLRQMDLVTTRRTGLWVHYRIHPDVSPWVDRALEATFQGIENQFPYQTDLQRLTANDKLSDICKIKRVDDNLNGNLA